MAVRKQFVSQTMNILSLVLGTALMVFSCANAEELHLSFTGTDGHIRINVDDQSIASYVYTDKEILRPYFAHVKAPGGMQVTRNHPPQSGDRNDHATMHPGIWLAFGDLSGLDFWRNKAKIEHVNFIQLPAAERNVGSFIEQKRYLNPDGSVVCNEVFRVSIRASEDSYMFDLESHFSSDSGFYFGDQEEMGLGVRVATPISEIRGGMLNDSRGRQSAQEIWSKSAVWCDYSGVVDEEHAGITIMCHPSNFRESWFHARDYGLVAANPFGQAAMHKGETSRVVVKRGETHVLRYAVWIHGDADAEAIASVYNKYAKSGQ